MLHLRIISAVVFFVLFFLGLFHAWFWWVVPVLMAFAAMSGLHEYVRFGTAKPRKTYYRLAVLAALALLADAWFYDLRHAFLILGMETVLLLAYGTLRLDKSMADSAGKCVMGTLYVALPLSIIMLIWSAGLELNERAVSPLERSGPHYLIFLVLLTQATDVGAYFTGRLIGRHKMAPRLSPGKTWEGFAGGIAFTVLLGVCFKLYWNNIDGIFEWWEVVVLATIFAVVGPLGDLAESWLKRNAGVKDSGKLIAGHGGMLDVIDSLLFTTAFYYAFLMLRDSPIV